MSTVAETADVAVDSTEQGIEPPNEPGLEPKKPKTTEIAPKFSARCSRAILFWMMCLILSAAGHWVYVALRTVDRNISSEIYRGSGHEIVWVGHGSFEELVDRVRSNATVSLSTGKPTVLPFSPFWFGVGIGFTLIATVSVWLCRWVSDTGIQSLVGLLAGHALWIGTVEIGLDLASRRLGLAGGIDVVSGRAAGVHGSGVLIQLSCIFLLPVLIGLTFHESNRCVVFQWFRRHLPISKGGSPSGRIDNYAPRTMIQFFMTVWVCYVGVLWMADSSLGSLSHVALLLTLAAIAIATPYMIWKTISQTTPARMLRYSVSGAVITWTGIEIASATGMMNEPWLSQSVSGGLIFVGGGILLTAMSVGAVVSTPKTRIATVQ